MNDFYIGYLPKAPVALAHFIRRIVISLGFVALAIAGVLVGAQMPFAQSFFEYGHVREFEGVIEAHPYPTLLVPRPGVTANENPASRYLLVAPGKHGADALITDFDGKHVRLRG